MTAGGGLFRVTEVVFYFQNEYQQNGRLRLACNLTHTAFARGRVVYIYTQTAQQAEEMDALLWTFAANSFVPHTLVLDNISADLRKFPVVIGAIVPPVAFDDVLISLRDEIPDCASRFNRLMEPVGAVSDDRDAADVRMRAYAAMLGAPPQVHYL